MKNILEVKDLHVEKDGKEILKGVNLVIEEGVVHALMGPNGSGKSTLCNVLMGHPKYEITKGSISFNGEDILSISVNERAKKGIFLSFQYPEEITGVTIANFLRTAYNSLHDKRLPVFKFKKILKEKGALLNLNEDFFSRYLNIGLSGGEKKKAEILQMITLDPKLAILDETDSGLDIDALRTVADGVNKFRELDKKKTVMIITHYKRILDYLKPDKVSILMDGKIVMEGGGDIIDSLEEKGYAWVRDGDYNK